MAEIADLIETVLEGAASGRYPDLAAKGRLLGLLGPAKQQYPFSRYVDGLQLAIELLDQMPASAVSAELRRSGF